MFFKDENIVGWYKIGEKLIESGKCIVAGDKCVWNGGIGNYIRTTKRELAIGCVEYSFDLYYFLSSAWFREIHESHLEFLKACLSNSQKKYDEIAKIGK